MRDWLWLIRAVLTYLATCAALLTVLVVADVLRDRWHARQRRRAEVPEEEEDWRDWPAIWP